MTLRFLLPLLVAGTLSAMAASSPSTTLWFDRPASYFEETLLIGNGRLGAILYGGVQADSVSLNDITLWTGEPDTASVPAAAAGAMAEIRHALFAEDYPKADSLQRRLQGHNSENYQPLGQMVITYDSFPAGSVCRRSLDLQNAVATTTTGVRTTTCFASAPDSVIVFSIQSPEPFSATLILASKLPHTSLSTPDGTITMSGRAAYSSAPFRYASGRGTPFCSVARVLLPDGGTLRALPDGALRLEDCKSAEIWFTNATGFTAFNRLPASMENTALRARSTLESAISRGYKNVLDNHISDYGELFGRVSLDLGTTPDSIASLPTDVQLRRYTDFEEHNPDLEELYFNFGRYLLIASARTLGVPANLQGLWNEHIQPPWSSNYTTNINVEENYWCAETIGLGDLHVRSLIPWIENLSVTGAKTAREYYGARRGWCAAHNSDIWAMTCPVGQGSGDPSWACWNMGGVWLATHIYEHWLFSRDVDFLRRYYPVMRGAAEFALEMLVENEGLLITAPSTSPENKYVTPQGYKGATLYGATSDLAMIRELLLDVSDAANTLDTDSALCSEITTALQLLRPYGIGNKGQLMEWYHDWDDAEPTHRHQSHLFGLYPGHHLSVAETPELALAATRTLEIKGLKTTGWSAAWRINLLARMRQGQDAYTMFRKLLRYVSPQDYRGPGRRTGGGTYPNLLDAHPPFQIDGNFGGTAGIVEMLLQSTSAGEVIPLPALPAAWPSGAFRGIRTRSGKTVDLTWQNGNITSFREY
ncbi:MAG: glycoside hydrolase family 95 protein [Muribaculaceae bacterium]|nr:glycoside hydrolase family 95 protein [Muribaculaceae bacterium]